MKRSTVTTVARDFLSMGLGSWGIVHQELSGRVSIELLVVYLFLLGVPAGANLLNLLFPQRDERQRTQSRKPTRRS